jgi:hypothetical protein
MRADLKTKDTTNLGLGTISETQAPQQEARVETPVVLDAELPPSGANGLASTAPKEGQTASATSMLQARGEDDAQPHRRGRTSALKVLSPDQIKREMGLNARKAYRAVLDLGVQLRGVFDKHGGQQ